MYNVLKGTSAIQLTIVFLATLSPVAYADVTGTIQGCARIRDNRAVSPNPATLGTLVPARHIVVAVRAPAADSHINPNFFAVTDNNGCFTSQWTDETRSAFPVPLRVIVTYGSSNGPGGGTTAPPILFQITRWTGGEQDIFNRNAVNANLAMGNIDIDGPRADEESAAYLTTREFFERIVARSRNLRERMPGLVVKTRAQGFGMFTGITPLPHEAWVQDGFAAGNPRTLAHELGHAITWAALQLNSAPINPLTDYMMNFVPGWEPDSREFSKAAFLEGMADFWSLLWQFDQNSNPTFQSGGKIFRVESGKVFDGGGHRLFRCRTVDRPWEFPFCHTAALWDLIDSDSGDGVDLNVAQIVDTLNHFPNNCISNGCRDEPGFDALNHLDFHRNAPAAFQTRILAVWQGNGISGGN